MLFHSISFAVFLSVFIIIYGFLKKRDVPRIVVLLVFSNIFYGWWSWKYLLLLWATIVVDYAVSHLMHRQKDKLRRLFLLLVSLATNIGILIFFKYYNFFLDVAGDVGMGKFDGYKIVELVIPVGLSFYVFQSLSYTIDVYRAKIQPEKNFINYAAFVCYFPQLVAGPIQRIHTLLPQIVHPRRVNFETIVSGLFLFSFGLFRKSIADTFATFVDPVFANVAGSEPIAVILVVLGFGLQIYLDFTGYVDMARGVSRVLGVELTINFNAPYLSLDLREFWRRWHISLSEWLRDYLYISLGGNKFGFPRQVIALIVTMTLGGLWHGAGMNFLVWGLLHGFYLAIFVTYRQFRRKSSSTSNLDNSNAVHLNWIAAIQFAKRIPFVIFSWAITFACVNYAWIYFRCRDFQCSINVNAKILEFLAHPKLIGVIPALVWMVLGVIVMEFIIRFRPDWVEFQPSEMSSARSYVLICLSTVMSIAAYILLAGIPTQQFLYFQF